LTSLSAQVGAATEQKEANNLDELVKLVSQKAGISPEQAKAAIQTVVDFLKSKAPAPLAGQIDGLLAGGTSPDLGKLAGGLGGLFGKK
jgi:hypothetical protein